MTLVDRIRKVEAALEARGIVDAAMLRENQMLFDDPRGWSRAAVGTWPRFFYIAAFVVAAQFYTVYLAAEHGWRAASGFALFLGLFQVMVFYALRRATSTKSV